MRPKGKKLLTREKMAVLTIHPMQKEPQRATKVLKTTAIVGEEPFAEVSPIPSSVSLGSSRMDFVSNPSSMLFSLLGEKQEVRVFLSFLLKK